MSYTPLPPPPPRTGQNSTQGRTTPDITPVVIYSIIVFRSPACTDLPANPPVCSAYLFTSLCLPIRWPASPNSRNLTGLSCRPPLSSRPLAQALPAYLSTCLRLCWTVSSPSSTRVYPYDCRPTSHHARSTVRILIRMSFNALTRPTSCPPSRLYTRLSPPSLSFQPAFRPPACSITNLTTHLLIRIFVD